MLDRFFSFLESPFNLSPDPRFFYVNSMYRDAYDTLHGVVRNRKGYTVLMGETGSGKTTLLKTLTNNLGAGYRCVYFEYSNLTFDDFLCLACNKLGLETERNVCEDVLKTFLVEQSQNGITVAFIIDEVQNMPPESLTAILTFTDGLSKQENLLQLIFSGQPQLEAQLEQPQLRALKERLHLHCRLSPLPGDEVGNFIRHRLRVAGNPSGDIMTSGAIQKVTQHAQGRPRLINMLCSRALITAYAASQKTISAEVMEEAIQDLREEQGDPINIPEEAPAQVGTEASEPAYGGPGHADSRHEVYVLPCKEEEPRKYWARTPLSATIEATHKALHKGMEKLSELIPEQQNRLPWKIAVRDRELPFRALLSMAIEATHKALHKGMVKLSELIPEQQSRLPWKIAVRDRELPFRALLSMAIEAARKTLHHGRKKLSGLISEQPIGSWKVAAIAALLWLLLYPALEQSPEKVEPVPPGNMTAQTSSEQSDQIVPLNVPAAAVERNSAVPAEKFSRTFYANNQNDGIEFFETAALEVITEQVDDTAPRSQEDLGPALLDGAPTQLTGFPYTTVLDTKTAATADSAARQKKLEQKLRAFKQRLAQAEAQLALSSEQLEKAHTRIQQHETQIEAYISQIGQLHNETEELKYRMVSFPEHLALQNINKPKTLDLFEQPPTQVQARPEIKQQKPTDPTIGIGQLLDRADELMRARHLTTPVGNNALEIFRQVLKTDPDNKTGLNGIERIKQQYLTWAAMAQQKRDWLNAGNYYKKALTVDPSNPAAEAGLREVSEQSTGSDDKTDLQETAKSTVREDARQHLAHLGIPATPKALLINAEQGNIEVVRSLLVAGISPNAKLPGNWTVLMSAATHGQNDVVRTLLRQGADVNIKSDDGKTALTAAAWNGHSDVVKELLASGAAVNEQNNDGWTALMHAAWNGHRQVVEMLLEGEASIVVKDDNNWTALTAASSEGHVEIVKILELEGGL